jgi:hypothetical protein
MLEALCDGLDGEARASGAKPLPLSLVRLGKSPVSFQFSSSSPRVAHLARALLEHARRRGEGAAPEVRRALERLSLSLSRVGAPRLCACGARGEEVGEPVLLAPPLAEAEPGWEETHEVHARVVGVTARGLDAVLVRLRMEDGASRELAATGEVGALAARLFGRTVRARVARTASEENPAHALLALEAWEDQPLLLAVDEARAELAAEGLRLSAEDWRAQLEEQG